MITRVRCSAWLLGGALAAVAAPALAEDAATSPGGEEPKSAPALAIAADVSDNATVNSQLRAGLYEVARRHGYEAAGKLDVAGIAAERSLMTAGRITVDPEELKQLRTALDVAVLVRVSKDSEQGSVITARVAVVTRRGVHAETVRLSGASDNDPLEKALDDLLPSVPTATPSSTGPAMPASVVGGLAPAEKKPERTKKPSEAWEERGGFRPTFGAVALMSATEIRHVTFNARDASGRPIVGSANALGVGGGIGARVGLVYLPIPDPNLSTGGFVAIRLGLGLDNDFFYVRKPKGYDYSGGRSTTYTNQALWVATVPVHFGFAIAAGRFASDTSWHGALIGFAYAPAFQFSLDVNNPSSGKFRANPAGAEASVDITRLDTAEHPDAQMQIRVSLWGLAPLDDDHPGMVSLGLGAIWY